MTRILQFLFFSAGCTQIPEGTKNCSSLRTLSTITFYLSPSHPVLLIFILYIVTIIPLLQIFHLFLFCPSTHIFFLSCMLPVFLRWKNLSSLFKVVFKSCMVMLFLTPHILNEAPNSLHCHFLCIFHLPHFFQVAPCGQLDLFTMLSTVNGKSTHLYLHLYLPHQ